MSMLLRIASIILSGLTILFVLASSASAKDADRFALIIANKNYAPKVGALTNPHKDAELIRQALIVAGFPKENIEIVPDKGRIEILSSVQSYAARLAEAGRDAVGFFYYSGHGAAKPNSGDNYIIPVTVADAQSSTLWFEAISLEELRRQLQQTAPQAAHIVIFDACRNELKLGRSVAKGFAPTLNWGGMLIAYSTDPGEVASDGDPGAPAGPYAIALSEELRAARNRSISQLFENVRFKVRARAGGQSPWFLHGLDRQVIFGASDGEQTVPANASAQAPESDAAKVWRSIHDTASEAVLESVLKIAGVGFAVRRIVIQALDVDRTEPWPDGQDCQEDQALSV